MQIFRHGLAGAGRHVRRTAFITNGSLQITPVPATITVDSYTNLNTQSGTGSGRSVRTGDTSAGILFWAVAAAQACVGALIGKRWGT